MKRDLSQAQFDAQIAKLGFKSQGFLGYYDLGLPNQRVCVSVLNAGDQRRDQIAYLKRLRNKKLASGRQGVRHDMQS